MPKLMVCLQDAEGITHTSTCELPTTFPGAGAVTIHFGNWHPLAFYVHAKPAAMERRESEQRIGSEVKGS